MRTLATTLYFLVSLCHLFSQGLDNIFIEEIPISSLKLQNELSDDFKTYRIFADLAPSYTFFSIEGSEEFPLKVGSLSYFYNTPTQGHYSASELATIPDITDPLYYDSWFTIGKIGNGKISKFVVPMNEDDEGLKDGFIANWQNFDVNISNTADLNVFGDSKTSKNYLSDSCTIFCKGISGSPESNSVCIGQFTTKGVFSAQISIKVKKQGESEYEIWLLNMAITPDARQSKMNKQNLTQNTAPYIEIISPQDNDRFIVGNRYSIITNATDTDGEINSVSFYINNKHAYTDIIPDDGFSFLHTAIKTGNMSLFAIATDNMGGKKISDTVHFSIHNPIDSLNYKIGTVSQSCLSSEYVYMPFIAKARIDSVIGFDVDLIFDPNKVTPTGNIYVPDNVIGNSGWVSHRTNLIDENTIKITIYKNSTAPANAFFKGNGEIFNVEFLKSENFHAIDTSYFACPILTESYGTYYFENAAETGMLTSFRENIYKSSITFWGDNKPIDSVALNSSKTEIKGIKSQTIFHPDNNGLFSYNFGYGTTIQMCRNLDTLYDLQPYISGQDAYFTSLVAVGDTNYKPSVFSIIAMDVNRDGQITAGDISQMQQRSVSMRVAYSQNAPYADWLFVPISDIISNPAFRISNTYPLNDNIGYTAKKIPLLDNTITLPINNASACPQMRNDTYKAILLGDATGNFAQTDTTYSDNFKIIIHPNYKDTVTANIYINSEKTIFSFDLSFFVDSSFSLVDTILHTDMTIACNVKNNSFISFSGFGKLKHSNTDTLIQLRFKTSEELFPDMLHLKTSLINEAYSDVVTLHKFDPNAKDSVQVIVYPNPALNTIYVDMNSNGATVELISLTGTVFQKKTIENYQTIFNVSNLVTGIYIIRVSKENYVSNHLVDIVKKKQ